MISENEGAKLMMAKMIKWTLVMAFVLGGLDLPIIGSALPGPAPAQAAESLAKELAKKKKHKKHHKHHKKGSGQVSHHKKHHHKKHHHKKHHHKKKTSAAVQSVSEAVRV